MLKVHLQPLARLKHKGLHTPRGMTKEELSQRSAICTCVRRAGLPTAYVGLLGVWLYCGVSTVALSLLWHSEHYPELTPGLPGRSLSP